MRLKIFETLFIAIFGGLLFYTLHFPLCWMLGPLCVVLLWSITTKRKLFWPVQLRNLGLISVGYVLGTSFSMATVKQIILLLPSMILVTTMTILFSFLMGYLVSRGTNVDLLSSIIGTIPGGLTQMVVLGEELEGIDATVVTFMQTLRLLAVVLIIPILVSKGLGGHSRAALTQIASGTFHQNLTVNWQHVLLFTLVVSASIVLGKMIKLPTVYLLAPLIGTAVLVVFGFTAPKLPILWIRLAQLCVGTYLGLKVRPSKLQDWRLLTPYTIGSSVGTVVFTLLLAWGLACWIPLSLITAILSTSPGGIAEMGVTAREVEADLSMVTAYQIFRIFFVLFALPPLLKWWMSNKNHACKKRTVSEPH